MKAGTSDAESTGNSVAKDNIESLPTLEPLAQMGSEVEAISPSVVLVELFCPRIDSTAQSSLVPLLGTNGPLAQTAYVGKRDLSIALSSIVSIVGFAIVGAGATKVALFFYQTNGDKDERFQSNASKR